MASISHLAAAAFGLTLIASTLSAAPAAPPLGPLGLTNARSLQAHKPVTSGGGLLTGLLQQTSSCNGVRFVPGPMDIVPPTYRALQWRLSVAHCVVLHGKYLPATIAIPKHATVVKVEAKNGAFTVPVH
jgi:hypothetical protein